MSFRRLSAVAGLAFVVLIVVNVILLGDQPTPDESVREVQRYLARDEGRHDAALVVGLFVLPAAVLFFAGLFERFRRVDRAHDESWGVAILISAVLFGATATVGDVAVGTLTLRVGDLDPGVVRALWDLQYIAYTVASVAIATLAFSVAIPVLRHRVWPAWFGWLTCVVGVLGIASAFAVVSVDLDWLGFLALPALVIWVLITSILMLRDRAASPAMQTA